MNQRAPTKEEQLVGVLTGIWSSETRVFAADPMTKLSIKRAEVLDYLRGHPHIAQEYLKRWENLRPASDINVMWKEKDGYKVAWMTWDGKPWAVQEFEDLNEAIAEHVCRQSGIRD